MLRIAIADDEERIRLGLAKLIRSASPNYEVTGIYANGEELLRHIQAQGADLVFTDIRMPIMNGLEFAERLQREHPQVKCIIVSGYHDFEYARAALRYRVTDYLIKPVDKAELHRLLREAEAAARKERMRLEEERRSALETALAGSGESKAEWLDRETDLVWYAIRSDRPIELSEAEALLPEHSARCEGAVRLHDGMYGVLIALDRPDPMVAQTETIGSHMLHRLSKGASVSIGASLPFRGADRLKEAFEEAEEAAYRAMYRFEHTALIMSGAPVSRSERKEPDASGNGLLLREEAFIRALQIVEVEQLEKLTAELFGHFLREETPLRSVLEQLDRLFYLAKREIKEFPELAAAEFGSGGQWQSELTACYKFEPMARRFEERFAKVLRQVREGRSGSVRAVEEVKMRLARSYKEELDLGKLAEQVFLTPSYLSKLFKQETGMTITDYAIKLRIEEAKQLLRSRHELKTYEVGEQVGYPDSAYFAKVFKKVVGVTPNEYRNLAR